MEVVICGLAKIVTDVDLSQRYTDPEALRVLSVCSEAVGTVQRMLVYVSLYAGYCCSTCHVECAML